MVGAIPSGEAVHFCRATVVINEGIDEGRVWSEERL